MFPRARVRPGAEETPEDEEASLLQQRDLTLRSALDQIQQRRRTPRHSPPPPKQPPVATQEQEGQRGAAAAVPTPPPHPQGGPLEALRQREWLLNLQEQEELQRLRASTTPPQQEGCPREKEEQLLFNGEPPPSPPPSPAPPPKQQEEVPPSCPRSPTRSVGSSTSSRGGAGGWRRRGARGGSSPTPRPPLRGRRGAPHRGGLLHLHRGWPPSYQHHRQEGMAAEPAPSRVGGGGSGLLQQPAATRPSSPGRPERVPASSHRSSSSPRPPCSEGKEEEEDWQEKALPRSEQDEASMLARALELSRLEDIRSCVEEERLCAAALEQSRREHYSGGRRAGTSPRRGRGRPPLARRSSGGWRGCPPEGRPGGEMLRLGRQLGSGGVVVGSIDAQQAPPSQSPLGAPAGGEGAEGVSFDQWLSMCSRYMPLLAQGMLELQRTCTAVRSLVPLPAAFDGGTIPFPPPGWPHLPPPPLPPPPGALLGALPPPGMPPLPPVNPPVAPVPLAAPTAALIAELTGSALRANHYGQLPRPPPLVANGGGGDGGAAGGQAPGERGHKGSTRGQSSSHSAKRQPNSRGRPSQRGSSKRKKKPAASC